MRSAEASPAKPRTMTATKRNHTAFMRSDSLGPNAAHINQNLLTVEEHFDQQSNGWTALADASRPMRWRCRNLKTEKVAPRGFALFLQSRYEYVCADPGRSAFGPEAAMRPVP